MEIQRLLAFHTAAGQDITIEEACESVLNAKAAEGLSRHYLTGLRQTVRRFALDHQTQLVRSIDHHCIECWLASRNEVPSSRRSTMGRLQSLFGHLHKRGLISENPMRRLTIPRVRTVAPRVFSPAEARELLHDCRTRTPDLLGFLVIGLFTGVRPFEILDLTWSDLDLDRGTIRVDRTKTGKRRIVPLEPAAKAWLAVCDRSIDLCPSWSTVRRRRRELRPDWPQDILRHTAASYLLALHQDAGKVAFWLGTSPRILMQHYSELVSVDDCTAFWELRP